jgi:hypothetical protein
MQNFQILPQIQTNIFIEAPNSVEEVIYIQNNIKIISPFSS